MKFLLDMGLAQSTVPGYVLRATTMFIYAKRACNVCELNCDKGENRYVSYDFH